MTTCKAAKRYLRTVSKHLTCSRINRAKLLKLTNKAINVCLDEGTDMSYSALVCAIGEPKAFAESLLVGISDDEVDNVRKKRRFWFRAVLISVALTIITVFAALAGFYLKYQDAMRGDFIVDEIWITKPDDMSYDDFVKYGDYLNQKWLEENER